MRVLVVDLSNLFWSVALAQPTQDVDRPLGLVLGRIHQLRDGYDRVVVACDGGRSFRTAIDPAYKSKRTAKPPALVAQLTRTVEALSNGRGCHVVHAPAHPDHDGLWYEADDVIASAVQWCATNDHDAVIVSNDTDLAALVTDRCLMQRPGERALLTVADVEALLGVHPYKVADWRALCGKGDDFKPFPGYRGDDGKPHPGIGEKQAASLIRRYGNATAAVRDALACAPTPPEGIPAHVASLLVRGGMAAVNKGLALATVERFAPIDLERIETPASHDVDVVDDESVPDPFKSDDAGTYKQTQDENERTNMTQGEAIPNEPKQSVEGVSPLADLRRSLAETMRSMPDATIAAVVRGQSDEALATAMRAAPDASVLRYLAGALDAVTR